ncbi:MAG: signal peptidase I [Ruminiclostridium sp.]|nr:signal peptidase I [Ruminiclostridium sp.]
MPENIVAGIENKGIEIENQMVDIMNQKTDIDNQKIDIEKQINNVENQKNDIENSRIVIGDHKIDNEKQKTEIGNQMVNIMNQKIDIENQKTENENKKTVMGNKSVNIMKEITEWLFYILSAVLVASFIQSQLYAFTSVHQSSMQDTLSEGHMLIMDKLSYTFSEPQAGDIIVFVNGEDSNGFINKYKIFLKDLKLRFSKEYRTNRLIKRVVAVEGDVVDIKNGFLYINDVLQNEQYVKGHTPGLGMSFPLTVDEDHVFVMGDNRENSLDSRSFGPIHINSIEGKAIFRIFPFSKIGKP